MTPYEITTINGLKVALYPIKGFPAVKAQLWVRAGSSYEEGDKWGVFHFLEHLCFDETGLFPDRKILEQYKEEFGIKNNAYTGQETVSFWTYGPSRNLEQLLTLLAEISFFPTLSQKNYDKQISIISQEHREKWDSHGQRFWRSQTDQLFGKNHPYSRNAIGQKEKLPEYLRSISEKKLKKLQTDFFYNQNSLLTVTGDFNLKTATNLTNELFTLQSKKPAHSQLKTPLKPEEKIKIHYEDMKQDTVILKWPTPGTFESKLVDRYRLWIASYIIGESNRSLLYNKLRNDLHLVYHAASARSFYPYAGFFEAFSSNEPKSTNQIIHEIRDIVYNFPKNPIERLAYQRAINYLRSDLILSFDSIHTVSNSITSDLFWLDQVFLPEDQIKILENITESEVRSIFGKYVTPDNEYISVMTKDKNLKIK